MHLSLKIGIVEFQVKPDVGEIEKVKKKQTTKTTITLA